MTPLILSRRAALLGAGASLAGCSAISALDSAATPLDTYDLTPVPGATSGRRVSRTLLVARPEAPAAIATDRIMVKPNAVSITYLPDARWSDELPPLVQSLLIRSIAGTGRVGFVGKAEGGPVPDTALLVRIDAFQMEESPDGSLSVTVDMALALIADRTQRIIATRSFFGSAGVADATPATVALAFQSVLNTLLPAAADWSIARL